MRKLLLPFFVVLTIAACKNEKTSEEGTDEALVKSAAAENKTPPQSEFADAKYTEMGKAMMKQFADGDIEGWASHMSDNVVYAYSSGDSLAGKKAVIDYWKDRRARVVKSVSMSNDIWLPIKVNQPQKGPDMPGVWLLCWNMIDAKYHNGKNLKFWVHQDMHYNMDNKVDRIVMYIDRGIINKALESK